MCRGIAHVGRPCEGREALTEGQERHLAPKLSCTGLYPGEEYISGSYHSVLKPGLAKSSSTGPASPVFRAFRKGSHNQRPPPQKLICTTCTSFCTVTDIADGSMDPWTRGPVDPWVDLLVG